MNEGKEITMLYDEIINIVTLAGEMILQAHEEELTIYDNDNTDKCGAVKVTMYAGHKNRS